MNRSVFLFLFLLTFSHAQLVNQKFDFHNTYETKRVFYDSIISPSKMDSNQTVLSSDSLKIILVSYNELQDIFKRYSIDSKIQLYKYTSPIEIDSSNLSKNGITKDGFHLGFHQIDSLHFTKTFERGFLQELHGNLMGAVGIAAVLSLTQGIDYLTGGEFRWQSPAYTSGAIFTLLSLWDLFDENDQWTREDIIHFNF